MAYKITTKAQREAMEVLCDLHRNGRVTFVGPDPDTGAVLFVHTEPGLKTYKLISRDGLGSNSIEPTFIDPAIWRAVAGE